MQCNAFSDTETAQFSVQLVRKASRDIIHRSKGIAEAHRQYNITFNVYIYIDYYTAALAIRMLLSQKFVQFKHFYIEGN